MRSRLLVIVLTMMLAVGLSMTAAAKEPIKLGAVSPLGHITGQESVKAMKLAVKEINAAGGLLGRPVELVVMDSELKPEKGAAALEKLATVDKVDIFIGGMSSGVHMGQIPILKKYKKVTAWIGAASHKAEQAIGKDSDWYFHLHPWDYQQGASYLKGWTAITQKFPEIKIQKQFMAWEEGAFGTASFKASKVLFKGFNIEGESFKSAAVGGGDYRSVLRHAKQAKPDVFIWVGYGADALPMMEQAKEIGFAPPLFLGSPPGWPLGFGKSPLANGVFAYGMWAPSIKEVSPISKHFWDAYNKEYGEAPSIYFCPLGYINVMFLAEGIKKAGTLDKAALIAALEKVEYVSPVGETLKIAPSAVIKHQGFTDQKILQWQKGAQQVIWPLEFATAKPLYPFPSWKDR